MRTVQAIKIVSEASDPKRAIMDLVAKALPNIDVMFNMVLLGTYIAPEKTTGGIIIPESSKQEDVYQGKVGLVLKSGPDAFVDDHDTAFNGQKADAGEWVVYRVGDAWSLSVSGYPCRLVRDSSIRLKVRDPGVIY